MISQCDEISENFGYSSNLLESLSLERIKKMPDRVQLTAEPDVFQKSH